MAFPDWIKKEKKKCRSPPAFLWCINRGRASVCPLFSPTSQLASTSVFPVPLLPSFPLGTPVFEGPDGAGVAQGPPPSPSFMQACLRLPGLHMGFIWEKRLEIMLHSHPQREASNHSQRMRGGSIPSVRGNVHYLSCHQGVTAEPGREP